jgi:methanol metabolism-related c-type cytochrome
MIPNRCRLRVLFVGVLSVVLGLMASVPTNAQDETKPYVVKDGVVDWYTFSGFRRYHAECHVCHGPDGLGSSFAPGLTESLKTLTYEDFMEVVVNGREKIGASEQSKMPAFGENLNVMCFIDDLYAYLKARSDGALGRGRPKKQPKPEEAKDRDLACMG